MEILEMPVVDETAEQPQWGEAPPVKIEEQDLDLEAFELWHEASLPGRDE